MAKGVVTIAVVVFSLLSAGSALGQAKDPFQPAAGASSSGQVVAPQPTAPAPTGLPAAAQNGGGLVRTGTDVELQVEAAMLLVMVGAAMLLTSRAFAI